MEGSLIHSVSGQNSVNLPNFQLEEIGFLKEEGKAKDVIAASGYIYVADEIGGLEIFNLTDGTLNHVSEYRGDHYSFHVEVYNDIVYLGRGSHLITILDVTDKENPTVMATIPIDSAINDILYYESTLFVSTPFGLDLIDVSSPSNPQHLGTLSDYWFSSLDIEDNRLFAGTLGDGLQIYDVSTASDPIELFLFNTTQPYVYEFAVNKSLIFMANDQLDIYNVTDLSNISHVSSTNLGSGQPQSIEVYNDILVASMDYGGVQIYNVSEISNPALISEFDDGGYTYDTELVGSNLFVADDHDGLEQVDLSDPFNPVMITSSRGGHELLNLEKDGNFIYVANDDTGFEIADVSDPSTPIHRGFYNDASEYGTGFSRDVTTHMGYVIHSNGYEGLEILDVSDPDHPIEMTEINDTGFVHSTTIIDNYAYNSKQINGIEVINLNDPLNPSKENTYASEYPTKIVHHDGLLYAAEVYYGISVFQIDSPGVLTQISASDYQKYDGNFYDLSVSSSGNTVFAAAEHMGVRAFDVSDPTNPSLIDSYVDEYYYYSLAMMDNLLFAGSQGGGMAIFDVSDPSNLNLLNRMKVNTTINDILIDGDYIYLAQGLQGLSILEIQMQDIDPPSDGEDESPTTRVHSNNPTEAAFLSYSWIVPVILVFPILRKFNHHYNSRLKK